MSTPPANYAIISVYLFISAHLQEFEEGNHVPPTRKKKEQETGIHIRDHMGQASTYFQKQLVSWKFFSRTTRTATTFAESHTD